MNIYVMQFSKNVIAVSQVAFILQFPLPLRCNNTLCVRKYDNIIFKFHYCFLLRFLETYSPKIFMQTSSSSKKDLAASLSERSTFWWW